MRMRPLSWLSDIADKLGWPAWTIWAIAVACGLGVLKALEFLGLFTGGRY